jgi:hypothetical protein
MPSLQSLIILCPPAALLSLHLLPQNMLLRRLWEIQQEQERQAAAASEAEAAAGMEVDGDAAPAPPSREQRAGVVQKELVEWYMQKQLERCAGWLLVGVRQHSELAGSGVLGACRTYYVT